MSRSVLIVDDSSVIRMFIRNYLSAEPDVEIREAEDGEKAVEAYRQSRADLVFLDLTMPVMDGVTALRKIMEMDPMAHVVIVTADIQSKSIEQVLKLGAVGVVKKPPLKEKIIEAFRQFEARSEGRV
jgi:two-component system chemotaxis response regulator CheY